MLLCWIGYYGLWALGGFGPFGPVLNTDQLARGEPLLMLAWCLAMTAGATIGALIATRHPRNPIGWLLFTATGMVSLFTFAGEYGVMPLLRPDLAWPGAVWLVWLAGAANQATAVVAPMLLFFPTGQLVSRRWRPMLWLAVLAGTLEAANRALRPGPLLDGPHLTNPFGVPAAAPVLAAVGLAAVGLVAMALVGGGASLVVRYRRAAAPERQQLKWIALAAAIWIPLLVLNSLAREVLLVRVALIAAVAGFVLALGAGVLRYRLYDVDIVINKALVYGALTVSVLGIYVGAVALIGGLLRSVSDTAVSLAATGVVAVVFQPLRDRLQRLANRLVYGDRASPYEVLAAFSRRVGEAISIDQVLPRIAEAAWRGVGASHARVRLQLSGAEDRVVDWPPQTPNPRAFDHAVSVAHSGVVVGEIAVSKPRGEVLTRAEAALLRDLASQAGPALQNVRLALELQARADELAVRAEELRASRQRIVAAQDAERRRLERDIHDGAQQHLVAMAVQLRLLKALLKKNPERAEALADDLGAQANEALSELRNLARGIFPPLLAERGLVAAVRSHVDRALGDVHLQVEPALAERRFAPESETAAYFCIREALQNAAKHAPGARVDVVLGRDDGWLEFAVRDNGPGFVHPTGSALDGSGLRGMDDRLAAVGGTLRVDSAPGSGTAVIGRLPVCDAPARADDCQTTVSTLASSSFLAT